VPEDPEGALRSSERAWKNLQASPPSHRREYVLWVIRARRAETRKRRITEAVGLIENDTKELK
jgi:uncharacterized protein YdeI (YjbR/CyaY-like superfamily)